MFELLEKWKIRGREKNLSRTWAGVVAQLVDQRSTAVPRETLITSSEGRLEILELARGAMQVFGKASIDYNMLILTGPFY